MSRSGSQPVGQEPHNHKNLKKKKTGGGEAEDHKWV